MKFTGNKKSVLMLLLVLLLSWNRLSVCAATLSGDMAGETLGQTTVTARVEVLYEEDTSQTNSGEISTGDETQGLVNLFMLQIAGVVITGVLWKKNREKLR